MWTIINFAANMSTALQVVFLFTCGQDYMRMQIKRGRRNFEVTRLAYLGIAITAVACGLLYTKVPQPTEVYSNMAVAILMSTKCFSAWRYYVRAREMKRIRGDA